MHYDQPITGEEDSALQVMAAMNQGFVVELDSSIAISAAKLGVELKIPMADSIILATAQIHNATIWTSDKDFKGIKGVKFVEKG